MTGRGTLSLTPIPNKIRWGLFGLAFLLPIAGPIISIIYWLMNLRRPGATAVLYLALTFLLVQIFMFRDLPEWIVGRPKAPEAEVKSNVHTIQIALERYAVDHYDDPETDTYPREIETLINEEYIVAFPPNPFKIPDEMKEIEFGSDEWWGEFSYFPVIIDDRVIGYYLLGYGDKNGPGYACPRAPVMSD